MGRRGIRKARRNEVARAQERRAFSHQQRDVGMACALLVKGGFSPEQYYCDELRGLNRYARPAFIGAIAVCVVGFAIKAWNER
jgi:hypothetical protein